MNELTDKAQMNACCFLRKSGHGKSPEEVKDIQHRSSLAGIWAHQIGKLTDFSNSCLRFFAFI
jgi:hypothetical protein